MKIDLPVYIAGAWVVVPAWIVFDLAPHLDATFAVHKFRDGHMVRDGWRVTNVETGARVDGRTAQQDAEHPLTKREAIEEARKHLAIHTQQDLEFGYERMPAEAKE